MRADAPPHRAQFVADHRPGALAAWSWAHLGALLGDGEGAAPAPPWPCYLAAPGKDRFIICDHAKNVYGSFYHIRVRAARVRRC